MKNKFLLLLFSSLTLYANNYNALLFNGNCVTCHHETKDISAPSITLVQKRYKETFPNKKDFIDYMSRWVHKPNIDTTIMIDQVKKYELMPELGYDMDTLRRIADYIYENDFAKEK